MRGNEKQITKLCCSKQCWLAEVISFALISEVKGAFRNQIT